MKALAFTIFTSLTFLNCVFSQSYQELQKQKDRERAAYWAAQGYHFNPAFMTAFLMDQKVKDIERAKYWKDKGYTFDPSVMTAFLMDQKVKDIERAKYWKDKGYTFDPSVMTAFLMDQKVKDIERAKYWKDKGYTFDPSVMTAFSMDQAVQSLLANQSGLASVVPIPQTTPTSRVPSTSLRPRQENPPVRSSTARPSQGGLYIGTGTGHWIKSKSDDGDIIILEDGSVWQVDPLDRIDTMLWLPVSEITIIESGADYILINTDDGEKAHAKLLHQ